MTAIYLFLLLGQPDISLSWDRIRSETNSEHSKFELGIQIQPISIKVDDNQIMESNFFDPDELKWGPPSFGRELWLDAKEIFNPNRWRNSNYKDLAKVTLGLYLAQRLDQQSESWVDQWHREENPNTTGLSWLGELGEVYSFGIIGGYYVAGKFGHNGRAKTIARDSFMASILASGVITTSLKFSVGRKRPYDSDGPYEFQAFSGNKSFPSGHTTQAFAIASVIAENYESNWVKFGAYGTASLVGISRIEKDAHFPSDVLAGALIGTYVGRKITHLNQSRRGSWDWEPYVGSEGVGIKLKKYQKANNCQRWI